MEEYDGRICNICGAKALGYNFGVISCESCKAFFRRNAFKDEGVTCPFANNCTINEKSRRFCQACRLAKCYQAGMKKDWTTQTKVKKEVLDEDAVVLKKKVKEWKPPPIDPRPARSTVVPSADQSIFPTSPSIAAETTKGGSEQVTIPKEFFMQLVQQAHNKNRTECSCNCLCGFYPPNTKLTAKEDTKPVFTSSPSIMPLITAPLSVPMIDAFSPLMAQPPLDLIPSTTIWTPSVSWTDPITQFSVPSSHNGTSFTPSPLVHNPSSVQSIPSMDVVPLTPQLSEKSPIAFDDDFSKNFATIGRNPSVFEKLTMDHRSLLIELLKANESLKMPISDLKKDVYTLMDAVKCADIAVRRMIMMAKNLKIFNELPNPDQMTLIKGGSMEMMILRGAMIYDPHVRSWKYHPNTGATEVAQIEMSLDILKGSEHFLAHLKFLSTFDDRIRTNEVLMVVIHALLLFSPDREGLQEKRAVQSANDKYHDLILRILECEFSSTTSREMLTRIETVIKTLKSLNSSMMEIVYGMDTSQLDPLIIEVFGIKTKNGI